MSIIYLVISVATAQSCPQLFECSRPKPFELHPIPLHVQQSSVHPIGFVQSVGKLWKSRMAAGCQVLLGSCAPSSAVSVAKSFMALVSRVTKRNNMCGGNLLQVSGTRAEPLEAAAQSVATGISTVLLWLADAICHCFLMLALLRPSRRTRKNRSRQQSAASGCEKQPNSRQARMCVFPIARSV